MSVPPALLAICVATSCLLIGFLLGYSTSGYDSAHATSEMAIERAVCVFDANSTVNGYLTFVQVSPNNITITGNLTGIEGPHGMHVHEYGTLEDECRGTGRHFNPLDKSHGSPLEDERHVGDLGNIFFSNFTALIDSHDRQASLNGPHSIIGRSLVIHARQDDLGRGVHEISKVTGNAGERMACCVIAVERMKN